MKINFFTWLLVLFGLSVVTLAVPRIGVVPMTILTLLWYLVPTPVDRDVGDWE